MLCPVCKNLELVMAERHGIEIDYCPGCRGVWLDRGELDKIIERAIHSESGGPGLRPRESTDAMAQAWPRGGHGDHHDDHRREGHESARQQHRRTFWKDLFD